MADRDRQTNGLEFRDRANRVMERVVPDAFDILCSRHPPSLLDRTGILVSGRGPARDQPPTKDGSIDAIAEEPEDMTAATGDMGSVVDEGLADGWAASAASAQPEEAAAPPPPDGGNPAAPPLVAVEVGDDDDDSAALPPAPAAPAPQGDPEPALLPQDDPPPVPDTRYPARARQPPSPIRNDLAQGNEMAKSRNVGAFTNVCVHSFTTLGGCMFSTKIRPMAVAMPTRHKALKTLMRDITNTDTVLNHIRTGHVALMTTHNNDLLSERQ